jgi:hypothetical protein
LNEVNGHGHAPGQLEAVLMKDENIIDVYDTTDAHLFQNCHEGSEQFGAESWSLCDAKANCAPL